MISAFKTFFHQNYHLSRTREGREFLRLMARYGDRARYQPVEIRFLDDYLFRVPDALSFVWQFKEIFADEAYRFDAPDAQPVVIDCGANVGASVLYVKRLYPRARVVAYEADPAVAEYLSENLARNHFPDVAVRAEAVWTHADGLDLTPEGADMGSVIAEGTAETVRVPSARLRDVLAREKRVDLLKIDIEGAEGAVLADCADHLGAVRHLFIEHHSFAGQPQRLSALLGTLEAAGFRYFLRADQDRRSPFVNRRFRNGSPMDARLNIFAYRTDESK